MQTPPEAVLSADLSQQFMQAYESITGSPGVPDWYLKLPKEPQAISEADRIQGLATIWAQARASYAFWADFPAGQDRDAEFRRFLPLVAAAADPAEYYRLLRRFTALLREGHSYVMQPSWIGNRVRPARRRGGGLVHPVRLPGPGSLPRHGPGARRARGPDHCRPRRRA